MGRAIALNQFMITSGPLRQDTFTYHKWPHVCSNYGNIPIPFAAHHSLFLPTIRIDTGYIDVMVASMEQSVEGGDESFGVTGGGGTAEKAKLKLSVSQIAAGALATVTATVIASFFGVYGTIGGAAASSVISTAGTAIYQRFFRRTEDKPKLAGKHMTGLGVQPVGTGNRRPYFRGPRRRTWRAPTTRRR